MKTLLVTGGAGFIGSNFIRYWVNAYPEDRIINYDALTYAGNLDNLSGIDDSDTYKFVRGDICDSEVLSGLFENENFDYVVNFAAESHVDRSISGPEAFVRTNINGVLVLLETARAAWDGDKNCRFLHVSTDEVYGSLESDAPAFTETSPFAPNSPYSASKASSDHLVRAYFHTHGLPVLTTNCSNNYGPFQFPEKLIPLVFINAMEGRPIPVYGDGLNIRDWLHVEDHCRGIDVVLRQGVVGDTYNIGGCNEWTNIDIVKLICHKLDQLRPGDAPRADLMTYVKDRPGHDRRYAINAEKMAKAFGWKPTYTFETGLDQTLDWYLNNLEWLQNVRSGEYARYYKQHYGVEV